MQRLALSDVEQIVHLVACAGDPTVEVPVPDRKRLLLEGVAQLVNADIWTWSTVVINPSRFGDAMATSMIDGGWKTDNERHHLLSNHVGPRVSREGNARIVDASSTKHVTLNRRETFSDQQWHIIRESFRATDAHDLLVSSYPLGQGKFSAAAFYRRLHNPVFNERDRVVVHVIFQQVDWLHRHGSNVPASEKVLRLSPRERQVMMFLLAGDSRKEVARKLGLSEHTVGDYLKQIYKHFGVSSRAELLAYFISGGQR